MSKRIQRLRSAVKQANAEVGGWWVIARAIGVLLSGVAMVALAIVTGYWASNAYEDWRAPKAWQYRIEAVEDHSVDVELDQLGAAGWELVHCRRATKAGGGVLSECTFKRRRRR